MASHTAPPVSDFPRAGGFTLIELMVTLAVAIILTMLVVPAVQGLMERQRLSAAVEAVQAQVALAKSEAGKRSGEVAVNVRPGEGWDVALVYFDQGTASTVSRLIDGDAYAGVSMTLPADDDGLTFEPVRGTVRGIVDPAAPPVVRLASANHQVDISVDVIGRMSICSPNFGRYPTCP
jgi:Tfp pilus assembly protein FimT